MEAVDTRWFRFQLLSSPFYFLSITKLIPRECGEAEARLILYSRVTGHFEINKCSNSGRVRIAVVNICRHALNKLYRYAHSLSHSRLSFCLPQTMSKSDSPLPMMCADDSFVSSLCRMTFLDLFQPQSCDSSSSLHRNMSAAGMLKV